MSEVWKVIPSWPDFEASDLGVIRHRKRLGVVSKHTEGAIHRYTVLLYTDGVGKLLYADTLVVEAFTGIAPDGVSTVVHLDGNTLNDAADNLIWSN